jgi:hypothetical protein
MAPPGTSTLRSSGDLSDFKGLVRPLSPGALDRFLGRVIGCSPNGESASWSPFSSARLLRDILWRRVSLKEVGDRLGPPQCLWYEQLTKFDLNGLRGVAKFGLGVFSRSCLVCIGSGDVDNLKYELGSFPVGAV